MKLKQLLKRMKCKLGVCIGMKCSLNEVVEDVVDEIDEGVQNIITNINEIDINETPKACKINDWVEEMESDIQDE